MDDNQEIIKLRQVTWKTNLDREIDEFVDVIKNDNTFNKFFGEKYIENISEKSKSIAHTNIKLGFIYTILMVALFSTQIIGNSEIEIFGYGFKNLKDFKELLLFIAVLITPVTSIMSAHQRYLNALVSECIKKLSPDEKIRKFYKHIYLNDYFDGLIWNGYTPGRTRHKAVSFLLFIFAITLIFLLATLVAGSFFIQINVIYDVATKPSLPNNINMFVIVFSITSIAFSWLVAAIQFPMPEIDYSNYAKLEQIKNEDPEKYERLMKSISEKDSKKEMISTIASTAIIYILTYTAIAIYWFSASFENPTTFLSHAMAGCIYTLLLASETINTIRKKTWSWFFKKYPEKIENRLTIFLRLQKLLVLTKIMIPFILTTIYAFYILSNN